MYIADPNDGIIPLVFPLTGSSHNLRSNWHMKRYGTVFSWDHRNDKGHRAHNGVDIYAEVGTPVYACVKGEVTPPIYEGFPVRRYGNCVWIRSTAGDNSEGYSFLCAHLDEVSVEPGQMVDIATQIGTVGRTGSTAGTAPHLHFEIHYPASYNYKCDRCQPAKGRLKAINPYPSLNAAQKREVNQ